MTKIYVFPTFFPFNRQKFAVWYSSLVVVRENADLYGIKQQHQIVKNTEPLDGVSTKKLFCYLFEQLTSWLLAWINHSCNKLIIEDDPQSASVLLSSMSDFFFFTLKMIQNTI